MQIKLVNISISSLSLNDKIPTIGLIRGAYGDTAALEWLKTQFGSLNDYAENGIGINAFQIEELSWLFIQEYYYINVAEICLFLSRFKLGKYGQFYGAIGPMKIASAMKEFINDRRIAIESKEREKYCESMNQLPRGKQNGTIDYEQFLELKSRAESGDQEAIELLKPPK